jgi:hypothetical protein
MRHIIFLVCFLCLTRLSSFSRLEISPKEAFFAILKVNKLSASDKIVWQRLTGLAPSTFQWGEIYAANFDKTNYLNSLSDEFQRTPYFNQKYKELNASVENFNLNKLYSFETKIPFGVYNEQYGCFPLEKKYLGSRYLYDIKSIGNKELMFNNSFVRGNICKLFNETDFDLSLKMSSKNGAAFLNSRKNSNGGIDRSITAKVIYNIVDKPVFVNSDRDYCLGIYIHRIELYNSTTLINTILPNHDFYDKVNFIRLKNGTDTIYQRNGGGRTFNLSESSFYDVVNYSNGKPVGKVKVNHMSGKLYTEGFYDVNTNSLKYEGKMTWFGENGLPFSEGTFVDGRYEGLVTVWYENGKKNLKLIMHKENTMENIRHGMKMD